MRMRLLFSVLLLLGGFLVADPAVAGHSGDLDCVPDFTFREDAQAHLEAHPGDPDNLDGNDNDGLACEDLPSRGTGGSPTTVASTPATTAPAQRAGLVQPPLAQAATGCHPSYAGACVPDVSSDVDCFRTANGPVYVDDRNFRVVGSDRYGLDADDDLIACESDGTDLAAATGGGSDSAGRGSTLTGQRALARTGETPDRLSALAVTLVSFGAAMVLGGAVLLRRRPPMY
jgi:hypothetical protein